MLTVAKSNPTRSPDLQLFCYSGLMKLKMDQLKAVEKTIMSVSYTKEADSETMRFINVLNAVNVNTE